VRIITIERIEVAARFFARRSLDGVAHREIAILPAEGRLSEGSRRKPLEHRCAFINRRCPSAD
jgi:hypothetical protein